LKFVAKCCEAAALRATNLNSSTPGEGPRVGYTCGMADRNSILLIEDDDGLAELLEEYLTRRDFEIACERTGDGGARRVLQDAPPDLVVLDLFLPGMNGLDVLRAIRGEYQGPILMLTASQSDADHVTGLELGADDFVTKPVDPRVLLARIRTLLRRFDGAETASEQNGEDGVYRSGPICVDTALREVTFDGAPLTLTTMEFDVICLLVQEAGRVVTRDDLYERVAGIPYDGLDRGMDVHVSRIRRKLQDVGCEPNRLKSVRGAGYLLAFR